MYITVIHGYESSGVAKREALGDRWSSSQKLGMSPYVPRK